MGYPHARHLNFRRALVYHPAGFQLVISLAANEHQQAHKAESHRNRGIQC